MEFNHNLLKQDINAVKEFFVKFFKSFGPSQKKVADKPIGFFEEQYIRFRFRLVDMGPVKWFKTVVVFIGAVVIYLIVFRHGDALFRLVAILMFVLFYVWVWGEGLDSEGKDKYAKKISDWFFGLFPKKQDKKK